MYPLRNLRRRGVALRVEVLCSDALQVVGRSLAEGKRFGFAVCRKLAGVVAPGGFCLFHDFNDARNRAPRSQACRVYQAVRERLSADSFEFYGIYGCTGLYRRR